MRVIFRRQHTYGMHDFDTLAECKKVCEPTDTIQIVSPNGLDVLSQRKAKYAHPSWVMQTIAKNNLYCAFFF